MTQFTNGFDAYVFAKQPGYDEWDVVRPDWPELKVKWPWPHRSRNLVSEDLASIGLDVAIESTDSPAMQEFTRRARDTLEGWAKVKKTIEPMKATIRAIAHDRGTEDRHIDIAAGMLSELLQLWSEMRTANR